MAHVTGWLAQLVNALVLGVTNKKKYVEMVQKLCHCKQRATIITRTRIVFAVESNKQ